MYSDAREVALEPLQCQEEAEEAEQDLHEAIARELRRLRPLLSAKLPETNGELKALYKKYDTRQRGSLTLLEWTKLVADLAIRPAVPLRDLERVHDHFLEATGAFTFDDLLLCVKAPQGDAAGAQGAASAPTSTKALQKLLLRVLYDKTSHMSGTLALTAFFEESDADKDGLVTAEEFWATISRCVPCNPLIPLSLQSSLCSSSSLGCLRAWQSPLHLVVSDLARPACVSCPLPL